jgi:hypothetical protein
VLDLQPAPPRHFLLSTSVLDRICAPLCDALLAPDGERPDAASRITGESQETLEALERANLFLVPLDDEQRWYRHHRLFADVLRARLVREVGTEVAMALHRRASVWLAGAGLLPEAIQHALAAGTFEDTANWVEALMAARLAQGSRFDEIERWLSALPEAVVRARPELYMGWVWLCLTHFDQVSAGEWADAAERALAAVADPAQARRLHGSIAASRLADLQRRLTVLIVGAGPTGVEVAGELAELMAGLWETQRRVAGDPPDYRLPRPRIILADAASTILSGWSSTSIEAATAALRGLGVEVRPNVTVAKAEPGRVTLKYGAAIEAGVLVWAGGVRAPKLLADTGLPTGSGGRVQVDRFQRVPGREEIFVVGDSALVADESTGRPLPPTADLALREGEGAALALAATLQGDDPSRVLKPQTRNAVSVGQNRGAATVLGAAIQGRAAHAIKNLIEWEYRESITRLGGISAATVV